MPDIEFSFPDGTVQRVEAAAGQTVMKVAVNNDIPGIDGECGGEMSCATCHVLDIDPTQNGFDPASEDELDVLSSLDNCSTNSRLGCQLPVANGDCIRLLVPDL
ncbi:2Fe-2S iron-sulfur cluster-binding protein [Microbacterium sp. 22303]|uniref:2Fe-2S iron-sulfur cluster-binding protein n=1 Tax=Microbacterium sp. 22303 TaxID=3453905 RepID=UPI003F86E238